MKPRPHSAVFFFLAAALFAGPVLAADTMAVLPFRDHSGFKGPWNVSKGVQRYLAGSLDKDLIVIPPEVTDKKLKSYNAADYERDDKLAEIRNKLQCRYLIVGTITEFYAIKKMAGSGRLGGYKHYNAGFEADVRIFDGRTRRWADEFSVRQHKRSIGMKVNLPGKISPDEENFYQMEQKEFGSAAFRKTVAGEAMDAASKDILMHLRKLIEPASADTIRPATVRAAPPPPQKILVRVFEGKILTVSDSTAYINLGFDDSLAIGDRFPVFAAGEPILNPETGDTLGTTDKQSGEVEIVFIKAGHLCSARITAGKGTVKVGDRARVTR